jgi:hypothetical protein
MRPSAGTPVARLHQHHVARHQLLGVDLDRLAAPPDPGDGLHHLRQRLDALLRLGLLAQADHRVEHRQPGQHDRGADVAGDDQVDDGRGQQDDLHEVAVLAQERLEARLLLGPGEPVRAVRLQPAARLLDTQAALGLDPELAGDRRGLGCIQLEWVASWVFVSWRTDTVFPPPRRQQS